jgi:hypothetical protein
MVSIIKARAPEAPAPRRVVIDGQVAVEFVRRPPLPDTLAELMAAPGMRVFPIRITGWRSDCGREEHRLLVVAEGWYRWRDGIRRDLRVQMCADCESVCVRDVSLDTFARYDPTGRGLLRPSSLAPRRRDHVLGWYTGARRNQRQYR